MRASKKSSESGEQSHRAHHVRDGNEFFKARNQGQYLAYAIADDFPCPLPNSTKMYVPRENSDHREPAYVHP
jgi:hypothetical protein